MPVKRQLAHLEKARALAHPTKVTHTDPKRFVFSVLVEGLNFASVQRCLLWNNIQPPTVHIFYNVQHEILPILLEMAHQSCLVWREAMKPGTIISLDGSWSHRRNAKRCLVDFVDASSKKVVDFEIVVKKSGRIEGDYDGPSNGMEREALTRMIPRWKHDTRVAGYCHDNDGKTRRTIREAGWQVEEYLDRNHIMHSFDKKYNDFKKKKLLWGLKEHLRHWMLRLICEDITIEKKKFYWEVVTVEHFTGFHDHCPPHGPVTIWKYSLEPQHLDALREFLQQTSHYLDRCGRLVTTQMNESLHAIKAHYANKLFCWGGSWTARTCVAILQVNEPATWKLGLYERLGLPPLDPSVKAQLESTFLSAELDNEMRRRPDFRRRENARRKQRKLANKKAQASCHDYRFHPAATEAQQDDSEEEISESEERHIDEACQEVEDCCPDVFSDDEQDQETDDHLLNAPEGSLCCVA